MHRFLVRLWRLAGEVAERTDASAGDGQTARDGPARELERKAHWAIDKVTRDIQRGFQLHTAIAAVMELVNDAYRLKDSLYGDPAGAATAALRHRDRRLADLPVRPAPRQRGLRVADRRPRLGAALAAGRPSRCSPATSSRSSSRSTASAATRSRSAADTPEDELLELARASENVARHLDGKEVVKEIVVPGKLVNLVVR